MFSVAPFGINHPTARVYEPGTNVLVTTWKTPNGWVLVRNALTMGPRDHEDEITPHTRPPADDDADHMLVRTVECLEGRVEVELICEPMFGYGRETATWTWSTTVAIRPTRRVRDRRFAFRPGPRARHRRRASEGAPRARAPASERIAPSPGPSSSQSPPTSTKPMSGSRRRPATGAPGWTEHGSPTIAGATRSSARLWPSRGLRICRPAPRWRRSRRPSRRRRGGERNWDYRYTWIRDSTFTLQALHYLNLDWEADEFMEFVADVEANEDGGLQIMYGIDGRRDLTESTLDHLSGYAGARPVRIGNGAFDQRQNDVFGAALDSHPPAHTAEQASTGSTVADHPGPGRMRDRRVARAGPGHLGGTGRTAALRLVEAHVLGRP